MDASRDDRRDLPWTIERRCLQAAVAVACLVPIIAGGAGMIWGPAMMGDELGLVPATPDSHFRYLSGLLCAIGFGFAATLPKIEFSGPSFRRLTALVAVGGLGRLLSLLVAGVPAKSMLAALAMELLITPALAVWQYRVARRRPIPSNTTDQPPSKVWKPTTITSLPPKRRPSVSIGPSVRRQRPEGRRASH